MDLGCGAGILGLLALQAGATVHFQDYVSMYRDYCSFIDLVRSCYTTQCKCHTRTASQVYLILKKLPNDTPFLSVLPRFAYFIFPKTEPRNSLQSNDTERNSKLHRWRQTTNNEPMSLFCGRLGQLCGCRRTKVRYNFNM